MDLISVVIPTYNLARYLPEALDSVFRQTYRHLEVIVVDDGSTDDTRAVLAPWDGRIVYLRQEHAGVSAARNAGIRAAAAPYIALLDADDLWMPRKLEMQLPVLAGDPAAGLVCSDFAIQAPNGSVRPSFFEGNDRGWPDGRVFDRILREGLSIATPTVVLRRSALESVGAFDTAFDVGEDYHLYLRIAHSWNVRIVPEVLCLVRQRPDGARPFEHVQLGSIRILDSLLAVLPNLSYGHRRLVRSRMAELECQLGRYRILNGKAAQGRRDLARALRHNPRHARAAAWLLRSLLRPDP